VNTMRRVAVTVAAAAVVVGGGMLANPSPATAHGATMFPPSRQFACWEDGLQDNGQIIPSNPACAAAVEQSGTTPLFNWFGNLNPASDGGTVGRIPDGEICTGGTEGPFDFSPYNAMRDDWPQTALDAGSTIEFRHNNWAEHPGKFDVYVTRQGWSQSSLDWADLELVDTAQDPPDTGGPGALNFYFWETTLPSDRSGYHIVFVHWVRSDSPEDFFNCSDVVFN
jgi:predicted carbohydrate-binding protein with CBM5 and CBM33 domain